MYVHTTVGILWFVPTVKAVSLSGLLSSHYLDMEIEASELIRALTDTGMDSKQCHVTVWDSDSFWQSAQGLLAYYDTPPHPHQ